VPPWIRTFDSAGPHEMFFLDLGPRSSFPLFNPPSYSMQPKDPKFTLTLFYPPFCFKSLLSSSSAWRWRRGVGYPPPLLGWDTRDHVPFLSQLYSFPFSSIPLSVLPPSGIFVNNFLLLFFVCCIRRTAFPPLLNEINW